MKNLRKNKWTIITTTLAVLVFILYYRIGGKYDDKVNELQLQKDTTAQVRTELSRKNNLLVQLQDSLTKMNNKISAVDQLIKKQNKEYKRKYLKHVQITTLRDSAKFSSTKSLLSKYRQY